MKLIFYISIMFRPNYWFMNYKFNEYWDKKLNNLLAQNEFTEINNYTAKLGSIEIWHENHPYASFCRELLLNDKLSVIIRPSLYTIFMANKKLNKALFHLKMRAIKSQLN